MKWTDFLTDSSCFLVKASVYAGLGNVVLQLWVHDTQSLFVYYCWLVVLFSTWTTIDLLCPWGIFSVLWGQHSRTLESPLSILVHSTLWCFSLLWLSGVGLTTGAASLEITTLDSPFQTGVPTCLCAEVDLPQVPEDYHWKLRTAVPASGSQGHMLS